MEPFQNSPPNFGNDVYEPLAVDPGCTLLDNQFINQEYQGNDCFNTFDPMIIERSNDFDSSAGIPNRNAQPVNTLMMDQGPFLPQTTEERKQAISQVTSKGPPIQISPSPIVSGQNLIVLNQNLPKSTDFKIEPEIFSIKGKKKKSPLKQAIVTSSEQIRFIQFCQDQNNRIYPKRLGFIPSQYWPDQEYSFGAIVENFFMSKGSSSTYFSFKLYNALQIVKYFPPLIALIGVEWVNDYVIKVNKKAFAMLLGINKIDGGLFHSQGNFPSYGFVVIQSFADAISHVSEDVAKSVDYIDTVLLYHKERMFIKSSTESDVVKLKYMPVKERK